MSLLLTRRCFPILRSKLTATKYNHQRPHSDFRALWKAERVLSIGSLAITPLAIAAPNFLFDSLWSVITVLHFHFGIESVVFDYVKPATLGPLIPKLWLLALYVASVLTLGELMYFNYKDIGFGRAIRKFWTMKPKN